MMHSANSKQEVDFQEHYISQLWVVWSHGPWPNKHVGACETLLCCSVWIVCPRTKLPTCP
jgi:hypothetical protein